jgi:transcriptional regulator GlxA family with amidase domain
MFGGSPRQLPQRFGFLLIPNYSMIAVTLAIEPLRLANRTAGRDLYEWQLLTVDGEPVAASNGILQTPVVAMEQAEGIDTVVVCGGVDVHRHEDRTLLAWLRRIDRMGVDLGAICTGGHVLAKAGLLEGHRCTIHWEGLDAFTEDFPDIDVTAQLFEIDRNRFTCAGGTAAADLMLHMIAMQYGQELAGEVSEQIVHERIRERGEHQRMSLPARIGVRHPKLLQIIERMQQNLEEPLSRSELAAQANLSTRQLERLFRKYLNRSPARYYLELRLHKARLLLLQTNMSVMNAALACGFVSASHFTKCYRSFFGRTPYRERGLPTQSGAPQYLGGEQ